MGIDEMSINEVWQWLADHYGSLEAYLMALDDEREFVNQRLMEDAIIKKSRWNREGEGILPACVTGRKLVEEAL